ncbi:glycosyltransferase family 4 protein [Methyloprofundus sp.]|uniref:glycosyltransferase family 4 protein n=1 Tax=Methyloprofundus sp. TaxID=2020875 RepID=UPI003D11D8BF
MKHRISRLRIAVLIRHYTRIGGAERYCVELTERLAERHEVHLFCQAIEIEPHPNIVVHLIPKKREKPRYVNQLEFSRWTRLATEGQFDIVHSHDMVTHANVQTLHVPCVLSRYTETTGGRKILRYLNTAISPRMLSYLWLEKKQICTQNNRQIIAVSEFLARNITRSYPDIVNNINIAYPGIAVSQTRKSLSTIRQQQRSALQLKEDDFVILFVANDYKRKGLLVILQALQALHIPQLHLVVVGHDRPEKFTSAINKAGLNDQVHLLGKSDDMHALYPIADALIHPTLADTYAMVVLEAMAHAIPVIVSNARYCGFSEHLTENEALLIDKPKDPVELAKHIQALHNDKKLRKKLAKNGREKARSLSWENTLQQTLLAYRKALEINN